MSFRSSLQVARSPMVGLAMVGVAWGTFSGVVPDIQVAAGVSHAELGTALMCAALGSMGAMFLSPRVYARARRWTVPAAGVAMVLALNLPAHAAGMLSLAVIMTVMGACVGMLDITSNIRISALEARHNASLMNISHAMFSFAFGGSALATGFLREAGWSLQAILPTLALAAVVLLVLTPEPRPAWETAASAAPDQSGTVPQTSQFWPVVLLTALILFASFIGENSTEAWSALHIEQTLGASVGIGSYGPAALGLVMGIARFFGQAVADRAGERNVVIGSAVLGALGALMLAAAPNVTIAILGVAVAATGLALVVPSANTVLGRRMRDDERPVALSRAWMIGMLGFFIGPAMMGYISELAGLRMSFVVVAALVALIIPAIIALGRIPRVSRAA